MTPGLEVGDQHATRDKTRYGCFLPDLTGLARSSPAVVSRAEYINPNPRAQSPYGEKFTALKDQGKSQFTVVPTRGRTTFTTAVAPTVGVNAKLTSRIS